MYRTLYFPRIVAMYCETALVNKARPQSFEQISMLATCINVQPGTACPQEVPGQSVTYLLLQINETLGVLVLTDLVD